VAVRPAFFPDPAGQVCYVTFLLARSLSSRLVKVKKASSFDLPGRGVGRICHKQVKTVSGSFVEIHNEN